MSTTPHAASHEPIEFELFTASYKDFDDSMGVPVQASNGLPRYPVPYRHLLVYKAPLVYPDWKDVKDRSLSDAEFGRRYQNTLTARTLVAIQAQLRQIAVAAAANPAIAGPDAPVHPATKSPVIDPHKLVLLCFEKDRLQCHRGDFARWYEAQTGTAVPEAR